MTQRPSHFMIPIGLYTHISSPYFLAPKLLILLSQGAMTNTLSHLPLSMNLCSNPRPLLFPLKGMSMYSARSSAFADDFPSLLSLKGTSECIQGCNNSFGLAPHTELTDICPTPLFLFQLFPRYHWNSAEKRVPEILNLFIQCFPPYL